MNKVVLMGRLTRDPEIRYSQNDTSMAIARFGIAVNRRRSSGGDGQDADFLNCVAFGKNAELLEKYFTKGNRIGISGHIQTGSYTNKEGARVNTTDIVVEEIDFIETRAESGNNAGSGFTAPSQSQAAPAGDGFMNIPDGIDEDLPFN